MSYFEPPSFPVTLTLRLQLEVVVSLSVSSADWSCFRLQLWWLLCCFWVHSLTLNSLGFWVQFHCLHSRVFWDWLNLIYTLDKSAPLSHFSFHQTKDGTVPPLQSVYPWDPSSAIPPSDSVLVSTFWQHTSSPKSQAFECLRGTWSLWIWGSSERVQVTPESISQEFSRCNITDRFLILQGIMDLHLSILPLCSQ